MAFDFLSLAIVTVAAFVGAALAGKLRQSVILGYLVVGVVLGAFNGSFFIPVAGTDIVSSPTVTSLADIGVAFLLFFVGLNFSVRKLRNAGKPSTLLAFVDYSVLLFSGFLLGSLFGWGPASALFLGGILAMSSLGIAAKSLVDLKRLTRPETEVLLGSMVVENFLSMALLTISVGWVLGRDSPVQLLQSVQGAAIIYGGFFALALFVMPRLARAIDKVRNEEVFVLLALTLIFASAGLAISLGTPFVLGTFFIGMAFSETRLTERLQLKLSTFRDAFVAIFFVHFGMNIDLGLLPGVLPLVAAAVALVLIDELLILSSFAVLLGFNAREAMSIGAATCGRGEDAIIYASIGSNLTRTQAGVVSPALIHSRDLFPIAGGLALVTSAITPLLMRHSARIADGLARVTPRSLRFGSRVVGAIFADSFGPRARGHSVGRSDPLLLALCAAFAGLTLAMALTSGGLHIALFAFCLLVALLIWREVSIDVAEAVPNVDFASLRFLVHDVAGIARYAALLVFLLLVTAISAAFIFVYSTNLTLLALALCFGAILLASRRAQHAIMRPPARMLAADLLSRAELDQRRRARDARRPARAGKGL